MFKPHQTVIATLSLLTIPLLFWILLAGKKNSPDPKIVKEREALEVSTNEATSKIRLAIQEMKRIRLKMALSESQSMKVILEPSESHQCQSSGSGLFLLVLVVSSPENVAQRETIRSAWREMEASWEHRFFEDLKRHNSSKEIPGFARAFQFLFYVGQPSENVSMDILSEWTRHGDLVIDDLQDSYLTLTMKTLRMIRWALENCPGAHYLMKTDDDVFINGPKFLKYLLDESKNSSEFVAGSRLTKMKPDRNPNSKWFSPTDIYSEVRFPTFLRGIVYAMGMEAARKIWELEKSRRLPLFHLEDVYITGIMANEVLGLELKNIKAHHAFFDANPQLVKNHTLARKLKNLFIHKASPSQLKCWTSLTMENDKELEVLNKKPCDHTL